MGFLVYLPCLLNNPYGNTHIQIFYGIPGISSLAVKQSIREYTPIQIFYGIPGISSLAVIQCIRGYTHTQIFYGIPGISSLAVIQCIRGYTHIQIFYNRTSLITSFAQETHNYFGRLPTLGRKLRFQFFFTIKLDPLNLES